GTVKIWEVPPDRKGVVTNPRHTLQAGHRSRGIAFSPDGQRLASGGRDGKLRIWEVRSGRLIRSLGGRPGNGILAFSPDNRFLARALKADGRIEVWDGNGEKKLLLLARHAGEVVSLAFSPDCRRLASAGLDQTVKVWNPVTGREELTLQKARRGGILGVAFSRDGRRLASAGKD